MRAVPAAAPSGLVTLLTGPPRPVEVAAVLPLAVHVRVLDASGDVPPSVCLTAPGAVRLPSALLLPSAPPAWPPLGARGAVGAGHVSLPGLAVTVARWWRTPRPRLSATGEIVKPGFTISPVAEDLAARLVGRGPGLTPLGDDILAGALVALRALGADADPLAHAVLSRAKTTTHVSAALLWHAARGECVPELARLLTTLGSAQADQARAAVLRLGHTSGAGLLQGVALGMALAVMSERRVRTRSAERGRT